LGSASDVAERYDDAVAFYRRALQERPHAETDVSPNTLSARLKRLEEYGVIAHRFYEQHPPRAEYILTDKGRALGPALAALRDWGLQHAGGRMHPKYRALETASRPRGRR
jgi:DNA-binding HxlR family transcriptional regulator